MFSRGGQVKCFDAKVGAHLISEEKRPIGEGSLEAAVLLGVFDFNLNRGIQIRDFEPGNSGYLVAVVKYCDRVGWVEGERGEGFGL